MRKIFMTFGAAFAMLSALCDVQLGQLERDASNQTALLDGVTVMQSGYPFEGRAQYAPINAFDGQDDTVVDLISDAGNNGSGTNTAYGVDLGEHGACVLTSAKVLSRNHPSCWQRSKGAVICGSNDPDWFHNFDVITSPTTHTGKGQWNEVVSTSDRAYRYLFIRNPDPTVVVYGPETAEIQFFGYNVVATAGTGGSVKIGDGEASASAVAYASESAPVVLTAVPAEGYAFAKWEGRVGAISGGDEYSSVVQVSARGELRALFRTATYRKPGQIERDPDDQTKLSPGIDTIKAGYNYEGDKDPEKAFDGNGSYVNLIRVNGDKSSGTNTAYGVNLGVDGACVLTSARVLSRNNSSTWSRSKDAVICGSNDEDWFHNYDILTPPTTHTGKNQWNEVASTTNKAYRCLFILNTNETAVVYGPETSEIQFIGYNVFVTAGIGGGVKTGDEAAASYIAAYGCLESPFSVTAIPDAGYSFLRWEGRVDAIVGGSSADATIQVGRLGELRAVFTAAERKDVGQLERVPSNQTALVQGVTVVSNGYVHSNHFPYYAFDGNPDTIVNLASDETLKDGTKTGYGVDFGENGACVLTYAQILGRRGGSEGYTRVSGAVICGSNDPDWFHNFEIISTATAPTDMGQWNTVDSISTNAYRYFFIYNPDPTVPAYGPQTAEIRLFGYNVHASASGRGKVKLGDGEAVSSITAYANADRPIALTAVPDSEGFRLARWEGRTEAIVSGNERSPVIQVGAHAQLTAVFERRPGLMVIVR